MVFLTVEYNMCVLAYTDFDSIFAQWRVCWTCRRSGCATRGHHEPQWQIVGQVHFIGNSLEETRYACFGIAVEVCAHAAEINFSLFTSYFHNSFVACLVHERPHVIDPATQG